MGKPPDYLVHQTKRSAVHFIRKTVVDTPMHGKTEMNEVACGSLIDADAWATRCTDRPHWVTCRTCWKIAHPDEPIAW